MTSPNTVNYPIPADWQHFERLCVAIMSEVFKKRFRQYGRSGQRQDGVDLYCEVNGKFIAVQCKGRNQGYSSRLTPKDIDNIVKSTEKFPQKIDEFYILTTGPDDKNLEQRAFELSYTHDETDSFTVHVFGWQTIITKLLNEHGLAQSIDFDFKLKEQYPKREFCTQYNETTKDFILRLCEEEGLSIFYEHNPTKHTMLFVDNNHFFTNCANSFQYLSDTGLSADFPVFKRFDVSLSSCTTQASYRNFNFQNAKIPEGSAQGIQHKKANNAIEPKLEYYDYPQRHTDKARGDHYAKLQIERLRTNEILAEAQSDIPLLHTGYCFEVENYPYLDSLDTSEKWLITTIYHQAKQPQVLEALGSELSAVTNKPSLLLKYIKLPINEGLQFSHNEFTQGYRNCLLAIPHSTPYRPPILHPKPKVLGSQTAIVTGAQGEEIYCDQYGRVKILLHWDRENPQNENSSHWVRVASSWAHDGYGAVTIPRVGMEVLITFEEGDPDAPIVSGAVHNGVNKVPYELPANKTISVFKTSSSKGGVGSNELRIEDKAGQEQIFVQSQKDFDQLTKNNHTVQINNNSHLQVQNEHSETIVKNRYTHNRSEEHHLTQLDRKAQIMMNDYKTVGMAEHETIGTIKTVQAGMEISLKSGLQTIVDGGLSLTLKAGGQHIVLNPAGIFMTMPVWTGGAPMVGTPSTPLPPLNKTKTVAETNSPPVKLIDQKATLKKMASQASPICELCQQAKQGGNLSC